MTPEAYAEFVAGRFDEAVSSDRPIVFTNRGTSHAKIVLGHLLRRAQVSLHILSGRLSSSVYNASELKDAAASVSDPVKIIVCDSLPFGRSSALCGLHDELTLGSIEVRSLSSFLAEGDRANVIKHFAVCDGKYIRTESHSSERTATVVLNADTPAAEGFAQQYATHFNLLWDRSRAIDINSL